MPPRRRLSRRSLVPLTVLGAVAIGVGGWWLAHEVGDGGETTRVSPRYEPPVMAGQMVVSGCSGGFYARQGQTIVLTLSAHCTTPGQRLRELDGRLIGVVGPRPVTDDCPAERTCMPSDFVALALARDHIPWGHLNVVDMGAGGYRELSSGTRALACADIDVGDDAETDGRERYRAGEVLVKGRYEHATDIIFPCIVVADMTVRTGDSGGAVLVGGLPAGVVSREMGDRLGFTPLAEGLEALGLLLCTTPDCDLSPATADQPAE